MFELFDLPNEKELAQIMLEGAKKAKSETNAVDTKTIFPFWEPPGSAKKTVVAPDKTGAVKVKPADFRATDTMTAWNKFLDGLKKAPKGSSKEPKEFGKVVVNNGETVPATGALSDSLKALKTTTVTDMDGKTKATTEELGVFKDMVKSNAAKPNKDKLVGIVKPKTELGKIAKKPKFDIDASATYEVKDAIPAIKNVANKMTPDKTGAVKVKPAVGIKGVSDIKGAVKPEVYDSNTKPQYVTVENGGKVPTAPFKKDTRVDGSDVKGANKKTATAMTPDKSGVVKPKGLVTAK